ncbi:MAG: Fic family protein [Pseudomonadota bacterium]
MGDARDAIARYDQMLLGLHNSELLMTTLRGKEAVVSSRMEGTISTLDEVLRIEAEYDDEHGPSSETRSEAIEATLYTIAMRRAQAAIQDGQPISEFLIKEAHRTLLSFGRGAAKSPGRYKVEQNYIGDDRKKEVYFTPISPEQLQPSIERLLTYANDVQNSPLLASAISHVEFEALHPFNDGNGRIGRMLITLLLWKNGVLSSPHFYVSSFFEENKVEYIERMRQVSASNDWTGWCEFFLTALAQQAQSNLQMTQQIQSLYENMKGYFREHLNSQWSQVAQDFVFKNPIFRNNKFTRDSGIPRATATRISQLLSDPETGVLVEIEPASGRRPALYAFEPLISLVR